jgi:hypothetical protein
MMMHGDDMRKRPLSIAYMTQTFPALTQTFVYRETSALANNGFDIGTYAIWKPDQGVLSQECQEKRPMRVLQDFNIRKNANQLVALFGRSLSR